jgi:DNA-binding protein
MSVSSRITITGGKPAEEYALMVILEFNRGVEVVELYGVGDNICLLADVLAELKERLGDSFEIIDSSTGVVKSRGRRKNYLMVRLKFKPV